jgi:hypothetical protein
MRFYEQKAPVMTWSIKWLKWRFWDRISLATAVRHGVPLEVWEKWQREWLALESKKS